MKSTRELLEDLAAGKTSIDETEKALRSGFLTHLGDFAVLDQNRQDRSGVPEVILAETKSTEDVIHIAKSMVESKGFSLLTRVSRKMADAIEKQLGKFDIAISGKSDHLTAFITSEKWKEPEKLGKIAVLTAGTSDIPYAIEVEAIARIMGVEVITFYDIGVSGIHRLVTPIKRIIEEDVDVIVVLAGMEGALPTVVASLVDVPVIGLPIPTGYGYGGKGETALASMLQSCAPGLAVVNIGNGLGAGSIASLIAKRSASNRSK